MVKKTVKSASASTDKPVRKAGGAPAVNIGISEKDRAAIASGLSHLLADTYTLYLTTHNFHWNVTGTLFNSLHDMFMANCGTRWIRLPSAFARWAMWRPAPTPSSASSPA